MKLLLLLLFIQTIASQCHQAYCTPGLSNTILCPSLTPSNVKKQWTYPPSSGSFGNGCVSNKYKAYCTQYNQQYGLTSINTNKHIYFTLPLQDNDFSVPIVLGGGYILVNHNTGVLMLQDDGKVVYRINGTTYYSGNMVERQVCL